MALLPEPDITDGTLAPFAAEMATIVEGPAWRRSPWFRKRFEDDARTAIAKYAAAVDPACRRSGSQRDIARRRAASAQEALARFESAMRGAEALGFADEAQVREMRRLLATATARLSAISARSARGLAAA